MIPVRGETESGMLHEYECTCKNTSFNVSVVKTKQFSVSGIPGGGGQSNPLQTGRRSVCGDDTVDSSQLESELYRLQRQLHVMEGDRRSYREESCNLIRKQQ